MAQGLESIHTNGLTVQQWTDAASNGLWNLGPVSRMSPGSDWRQWALSALGTAAANGIVLPDPYQFDDWRRWANRYNEIIDGTYP